MIKNRFILLMIAFIAFTSNIKATHIIILASFIFCSDAFGQCTASICGITNVSCNGAANGEACVSISGGTAPYNYVWSNGASTIGTSATFDVVTGLSGGITVCDSISSVCGDTVYTITVTDALGCVATASVTIEEGPPLNGWVNSITDVSCNGACDGFIFVSACGGTCPSSILYLWDDGSAQTTPIATGLCPGNYSVRITPSGSNCDTIYLNAIVVAEPPLLTATISGNPPCNTANDGSATVSPAGGTSPYTYLWNASTGNQTTQTATGLSSNTYSVTVTDANGCTAINSIIITELNPIIITSIVDTVTQGNNDGVIDITVSGGFPPYSYLWSTGDITEDVDSLTADIYTVIVTDSLGCIDSLIIEVPEATGINYQYLINKNLLKVYPNPTTGHFTLKVSTPLNMTNVSIKLYQITGQQIFAEEIRHITGTFSEQIDLSNYAKGMYYLQVVTGDSVFTRKIVYQ